MNPILSLLAPLALLVPVPGGVSAPGESAPLAPRAVVPSDLVEADVFDRLDPAVVPIVDQVRIEQRVIVRIAPPGPTMRLSALPTTTLPPEAPRLVERKMGKCVPVRGIAAVQPDSGSRLLLLMRDRRLISANLEKACRARDFYSGFYLERAEDGMLCVERDKLHSRAGANCEISKMRQLVSEDR